MMKFKNQTELFDYIWETREHKSELSGQPLLPKGHLKWHWQFLHVLPKGSYPSEKLNPNNVLLGTVYEHDHQEQFVVFKNLRKKLTREYHEKHKPKKIK